LRISSIVLEYELSERTLWLYSFWERIIRVTYGEELMTKSKNLPLVTLHLTVLIWAGSALFAKIIELPAQEIIFLRSIPALMALTLAVLAFRLRFTLTLNEWVIGGVIGILTAGHWVTFYESVQRSSVAVGLITLYTYPLFTALIEPLLHKKRPTNKHLFLGCFGLLGVVLIAFNTISNDLNISALLFGIGSSLFFTARNLGSKYLATNIPSLLQMWLQVLVTFCVLLLIIGYQPILTTSPENWVLLCLLGTVFVALPHTLFLFSLKHLQAAKASLMSMIQPLYGIILGVLILSEIPTLLEIIGGLVILITATLATKESST
jgi:drug/metabolite transporter (DMT)-like permease